MTKNTSVPATDNHPGTPAKPGGKPAVKEQPTTAEAPVEETPADSDDNTATESAADSDTGAAAEAPDAEEDAEEEVDGEAAEPAAAEQAEAEPADVEAETEERGVTVTVESTLVDAGADPLRLATPMVSTDPTFTGAIGTVTGVVPQQDQAPAVAVMPAVTATAMPTTTAVPAASVHDDALPPAPLAAPAVGTSEETRAETLETGRSSRRTREDGPEPAAALTSDRLLTKAAAPPVDGWRRLLYTLSFGSINLGDSDKVRLQRSLENSINTRLGDHTRYVPVLSRKGGVGKTTVTTLLGMVLADTREDRVIAMDANPDRGTLSDRSPGRADFTARNLVKDRFTVTTFSQLSSYVARDGSRLDVLASDTDPTVAQAFDDADYRAVTDILSKYYSIVLTDSGTGMVHSVMKGTLEKADAVVLVSGGSVDEARLASETLSWLEAHGRHDLVARAIVVINMAGGETQVDIDQIEDHFRSRVNHVLRIPYDKHLAEGSRVELDKLHPATRAAATRLAALVVGELQEH